MLADPGMEQRGGYLVPRVAGAGAEASEEGASAHVIRLDTDGTSSAPRSMGGRPP